MNKFKLNEHTTKKHEVQFTDIIKTISLLVFFVLFRFSLFSQTPGEWTWMHGNNTPFSPGVFGTQGVPSAANTPPALYEACEWIDNSGNFWLFGGDDGSVHTALWKFNPVTNEWTWMKGPSAVNQNGVYGVQGVSAAGNYPGSREWGVTTWTDTSGNLWLFGGYGYAALGGLGYLNDLWKYDISTNQWTWIKGPNTTGSIGSYGTKGIPNPSNLPRARAETSCSWTDNTGNLWLYGGNVPFTRFGDLWKYNISTNEWTWMHGANTANPPAIYGTQGVATLLNTPGGRLVYSSWADLSGNLWLFGGGNSGVNNDLWKYDISTNQWTWMQGPNTINNLGNYGTKCVSNINNKPPARYENRARVKDACGNFWNFGGLVNISSSDTRNDLWHYNVFSNQWTWVSGDNIVNQLPVYGIQGVSAPANKPGAKGGSVAWLDNNGYIWVFGGWNVGGGGKYNDLFRYVPPGSFTQTQVNVTGCSPCNGSATINFTCALANYSYVWSNGSSTLNTSSNTNTITGLCAGTYTVTATSSCSQTQTTTFTITGTNCGCTLVGQFTKGTANCTNCGCKEWIMVTATGGTAPYSYAWPDGYTNRYKNQLCPGTHTINIKDKNGCSVNITAP